LIDRKQLMDEWPALYNLESIEQVKAIADELRQRILEELVDTPRTVTQLGERLGISAAKVHYHARELERVGLLKLVQTREKGGILEKYYRTVALRLSIPPDLLQSTNRNDVVGALQAMLGSITDCFTNAMLRGLARDADAPLQHTALVRDHVYLTDEQFLEMNGAIDDVLKRYAQSPPHENARQYTTVVMAYDTALSMEEDREPAAPADARSSGAADDVDGRGWDASNGQRAWTVGVQTLKRQELEKAIVQGRQLDIWVVGLLWIADDVTPDLAERAISRLVVRGKLRAPEGVLEVLARKDAQVRGD
jgi:DNA-binding transcriptional ArsR family regulator